MTKNRFTFQYQHDDFRAEISESGDATSSELAETFFRFLLATGYELTREDLAEYFTPVRD